MTSQSIMSKFLDKFPSYKEMNIKYYSRTKDSIRLFLPDKGEVIFTFTNDSTWKLETYTLKRR